MSRKIKKNKKIKKRRSAQDFPEAKKPKPAPRNKSVSLSRDQAFQLAVQHFQAGNLQQAEHLVRQLLNVDPDNSEANHILGLIFAQQGGKPELAIYHIRKAIQAIPSNAAFHHNLGLVLDGLGRMEDAIICYRQALSIKPDYAEVHFNLGNIFKDLGRTGEAITSYRKALFYKSDFAEVHNNLGIVYKDLCRMDEAITSYRKALSLNPDFAEAHNNLGNVFKESGKLDDAISCFKKARFLKPDFNIAHSNLLSVMNYCPLISQEEIFKESLAFAKIHASDENRIKQIPPPGVPAKKKLRIGYISPDFKEHSVAYFFETLLREHNREHFEIYCYSDVMLPDMVTNRIQKEVDKWLTIAGKNNEQVFALIMKDQIDILVELAGHTANNRLLLMAQNPAPIQVSWLGYPNTTGLKEICYRFTDDVADPKGKSENFYSEELIHLKDGFLCYNPYDKGPDVSKPPCLGNDIITFGSFNNLAKVTPDVVELWAKILLRIENSRLVLKAGNLMDESTSNSYMKKFQKEGISSDRIKLLGRIPDMVRHLTTYNTIDIALDPFPYNGTTTTCEALWMGVPVVTLLGDRHAGRVGASILHAVGMADLLVADGNESYVERAVALAEDKEQLQRMRKNLRQQMIDSPLCDEVSFAKKIEEAYQNMWARFIGNNVKED